MKNEALVRVFSVVLVIMAVVLLLAGIYGFSNALNDRKENIRVYDLLSDRAAEYEEISNRLAQGDSLDKVQQEREKLEAQHEKNRASHQIALATYTATRGALKEGEEAMSAATSGISLDSMLGGAGLSGIGESVSAYATDVAYNAYANIDVAMNKYENAIAAYASNPNDEQLKAELDAATAELEIAENYVAANFQQDAATLMNQTMSTVSSIVSGLMQLEQAKDTMQTMKLKVLSDSISLAVGKADLDKESETIDALLAQEASIRADQRRLTTLKVNLSANENIKKTLTKSSDVLSAARNEMTRFGKEYRSEFRKALLVNLLMILAAASAIAGVPAAYGRTDKRALLILPVIVYTICCIAAEGCSLLFWRSQQYAALFAGLFGILQLFLILPKENEEETEEED